MQIYLQFIFWLSFFIVFYAYWGYPLTLILMRPFFEKKISPSTVYPSVTIICPVYNESRILPAKIQNTLGLNYPQALLQIIFISDASTDDSDEIIEQHKNQGILGLRLPKRTGKAAALNLGLEHASHDIIVFTDASIMLNKDALANIVAPFTDLSIGCVSGEDSISSSGGEGLYGRYELLLRRLESCIGSIVGASGCFYAQRRSLVSHFPVGVAPDFYSVLKTAETGHRSIAEPAATGEMKHVPSWGKEFQRKTRTFLRGITALMHCRHLLNIKRYGLFAFFLWSHKVLRWISGFAMVAMLLVNLFLLPSFFWFSVLMGQSFFYALAISGWLHKNQKKMSVFERIPLFFCLANLAATKAWIDYLLGKRIEIWSPSKR